MKNLLLVITLLFLLSLNAATGSAQSASVLKLSGKVLNARNQPVAGATISAAGRNTAADADGVFVLSLQEGKYTVVVSAVGYQTKEITDVEVKSGIENLLDVVLNEKKSELEEVVVRSSRRQERQQAPCPEMGRNPA